MKPSIRIGQGYDIHQLVPQCPLILGGVPIPHHLGLQGHSDADCLSHAITDAILGAAGLRDIGHFYPDTDPQIAGIDSQIILREISLHVRSLGWQIVNIDSTVIAQKPKLLPHLDAMQAQLAQSLGIDPSQIGIKATTHETLDAIGQEKGIAAHAVCLLQQQD